MVQRMQTRKPKKNHSKTCKECGIWEIDMEDNRCKRCWTTTLAKNRIAERENRCVVENCINIGKYKFSGHSICGSHKKRIPGPLEVYAASWTKAGEDADC